MSTMELSAYNEYLEPCCMCDSEHTNISIVKREALGDLSFSYDQLGILCLDCGFSFVNNALSAITLKNRDKSEKNARRCHVIAMERKINTPTIIVGSMKRRATSTARTIFNRANSHTSLSNSFEEVETIHSHSSHVLHAPNEGVRSYKYTGR